MDIIDTMRLCIKMHLNNNGTMIWNKFSFENGVPNNYMTAKHNLIEAGFIINVPNSERTKQISFDYIGLKSYDEMVEKRSLIFPVKEKPVK